MCRSGEHARFGLLDGKRGAQRRRLGTDDGEFAALWQGDCPFAIRRNGHFGCAHSEVVRGGVLIHDGQGASEESHDVGSPKLAVNNANSCIQGDCWALRRNKRGGRRAVQWQDGECQKSSNKTAIEKL